MTGLRGLKPAFVVPGPVGVTIRSRLRVSSAEATVLTAVGVFLGSLASKDLAVRSREGTDHDASSWAARKRELSVLSSARWAGSVTKATHDQWALARRGHAAEMAWLRGQITRIEARPARPLGAKADKRARLVRGYATRSEWHAKSRRLQVLRDRLAARESDWSTGRVSVVRGGKKLAHLRHHLDEAGLSAQAWRERWDAARMFLAADGESGPGCSTTLGEPGRLRSRSKTSTSARAAHGRRTVETSVSAGSSPASRPSSSRPGSYRWLPSRT